MYKEMLNGFCGKKDISIVEGMAMIDKNSHGILFIVDDEGGLIGSLTDGDIRRWLIKTGDLSSHISKAMNPSPKKLLETEKKHGNEYMKEQHIKAVPVVNGQNIIVDILFAMEESEESVVGTSNTLQEVPVVIMAGGKGTRLYPYTKILPKPLIPIGDVPILERIIERFLEYGVEEYYLTVNYKKEMIKSYFSELNPSYALKYVEEEKPLGTAGSIRLIEESFHRPFFVTNCDILIKGDYEDIYRYHLESGNAMTIVTALKNIVVPYGVINSKENGVVQSMEEKPNISYFVNTGMYVINPEVIDKIPEDTMFHMTHLVETLMKEGQQVGMYPVSEESFLDMGEFEEMHRMEEKLKI